MNARTSVMNAARRDLLLFGVSLALSLAILLPGAEIASNPMPAGIRAGAFGVSAIYAFGIGALVRPHDTVRLLLLAPPIAALATLVEAMATGSHMLNGMLDGAAKPAVDLYRTQRLGIGLGMGTAIFLLLATARRSFARILALTMHFALACVLLGYHTTTVLTAYDAHKEAKAEIVPEIDRLVRDGRPERGEICPPVPVDHLLCLEIAYGENLPHLGDYALSTTVHDFAQSWATDPAPRSPVSLKHSAFDATHAKVISIAGGWIPTEWGGVVILTDRAAEIDLVFSEAISVIFIATFAAWGSAGVVLSRLHPGAPRLRRRTA